MSRNARVLLYYENPRPPTGHVKALKDRWFPTLYIDSYEIDRRNAALLKDSVKGTCLNLDWAQRPSLPSYSRRVFR